MGSTPEETAANAYSWWETVTKLGAEGMRSKVAQETTAFALSTLSKAFGFCFDICEQIGLPKVRFAESGRPAHIVGSRCTTNCSLPLFAFRKSAAIIFSAEKPI
jgi:hypothetical protein